MKRHHRDILVGPDSQMNPAFPHSGTPTDCGTITKSRTLPTTKLGTGRKSPTHARLLRRAIPATSNPSAQRRPQSPRQAGTEIQSQSTSRRTSTTFWSERVARNVWHLHGSINSRKCEWHKSITNLDGDINFKCDYQALHTEPVKLGDLCPKCGGQCRPDVVWFGEAVDMKYKELDELAQNTRVFIGIGTTAQVQPAAGLLFTFRIAEKKYFIDLKPPLRLHSFTRLEGKAGDHMPPLAEELLLLAENRT